MRKPKLPPGHRLGYAAALAAAKDRASQARIAAQRAPGAAEMVRRTAIMLEGAVASRARPKDWRLGCPSSVENGVDFGH
jgi:hypothetical protein